MRGVDMAAPNPAPHLAGRREVRKIDRLRIVYENDVRLQIQPCGVLAIDLVVQIEVAFPERHRQTLHAVVKGLGDAIEVGRSGDHFPAGVDPQFFHERNHPAQDFGHAAAAAGGIDVNDPLAGQPFGQPPQAFDLLVSHDVFVAVQELHGALLASGGAAAVWSRKASTSACRSWLSLRK